jgi:hypothetical protein
VSWGSWRYLDLGQWHVAAQLSVQFEEAAGGELVAAVEGSPGGWREAEPAGAA